MSSVSRVPETSRTRPDERSADDVRATVRALGWSLVPATFARFRYGDGFSNARALALQLLLAVVPLVIATVGVSSSLDAGGAGEVLRRTLLWLAPASSEPLVDDALTLSRADDGDTGEAASWLGLLVAVLALTTGMGQLERGANRIYGVQRDRPTLGKYGRAVVMALLCGVPVMLGLLLVVAATAVGRAVQDVYGVPAALGVALALPGGAVLVLAGVTGMLAHAPYRKQPSWSWLALGGAVAVVLSLLLTGLLAAYLHLSDTVGGIYGPLTAVMALIVWAQTTATSILLGVALCAQLEAARAAGTTGPAAR